MWRYVEVYLNNIRTMTKKTFIISFIVALILTTVVTMMVYADTTQYAVQAPIVEVEERDNIDKLTDNLNTKMREEEEARAQMQKAHELLIEAQALHDLSLDELNKATEAINTYQGITD